MNRFSFKIYAVLLVMGAVPLLASALLLSEVLTFNAALQAEAVDALDHVSDFHRAWARSEASRIRLLGELLSTSPELIEAAESPTPENIKAAQHKMKRTIMAYDILLRAELKEGEKALAIAATPHPPPEEEVKTRQRDWPLIDGYSVVLTFGVDGTLADRYEALGERRNLHRALAAVEDEQSGSISDVYQQVYYMMLALVILLTVGFALLITLPLNRRVSRLASATSKVSKGDLTVQIPVKGKDELALLTEQFNEMVTDLADAQRSLAYVERMRAWQEVARRLAHEIKNPLTPLLLAIQQLDKTFDNYLERPETYRMIVTEVVEIVTEEVDTLRKLVKDFSEFARLPSADPKPRDVWEFVTHTLRSNPQFEDQAEIRKEGELGLVAKLDPALMRRVLVNVVRNAIEAVKENGGEPSLELSLIEVDDGETARVVIRDNGPGLTSEQEERIFEPYFTTKETGTGLGLAIVRKIMLDHGGDIRLINREDGAGAEALLDLPILSEEQLDTITKRSTEEDEATENLETS